MKSSSEEDPNKETKAMIENIRECLFCVTKANGLEFEVFERALTEIIKAPESKFQNNEEVIWSAVQQAFVDAYYEWVK